MLHTSPPCPPLSFLCFPSFFGLSLRLFRSFLRLVSLPQSRAKYSLFATPYSPALLALLFLFFFLSFLRLFRCLFRFLRQSAAKRLSVCVCVTLCVQEFSTRRGTVYRTEVTVQRRVSLETSSDVPAERTLAHAVTPLCHLLVPWWFHATPHKQVSLRRFPPFVSCCCTTTVFRR